MKFCSTYILHYKLDSITISLYTLKMDIVILRQVEREFKKIPKDVLSDTYALFDDLARGKKIGMPHSRPLPNIARGLHELRLSYIVMEYTEYSIF